MHTKKKKEVNPCGYKTLEFEFHTFTSLSSNHNPVFIVHLYDVLI